MGECLRAEARVLNLGRTSWHYDGGRRAAAARPPQSRWGARVSKRVAGRAIPDFSEASPTPRMPAVLSRESSPKPRPVSTVPEWSRLGGTHSRPGQSRQRKRVARRRRLRRGRCEAEMARPPPCFADRARRGLLPFREEQEVSPLPRPEQRRMKGSPVSRGRRHHCSASKTRGPGQDRWSRRPAPPRPPPRRPALRRPLPRRAAASRRPPPRPRPMISQSVSLPHLQAWRTGPHAHTRCKRLAREPTRGTLSPALAPGPDCWTHSTQLTGQLTRWRYIMGFSGTDT